MSFQLTKKQIIKEIIQSGKNPSYFINNYCLISHPMKGRIPFRTYPFQEDCLVDFNDYRFNVVLKARQLGLSTLVAAYCVWFMLFHKEKNILILATKLSTATNLVRKVKMAMKNLPAWIKISEIIIDNRTSFELSNGSIIKASSTSTDAGRSEALSLLVLDEAAHIENMNNIWTSIYPTLSTGGRCIALSTPNGVGNWFHKIYTEAIADDNEFHTINLPWQTHPDRDQAWFEKETRNMSKRQIAQELECSFNASGETVVHPDDLEIIFNNIRDPIYRTGYDRNFWLWERYDPNFTYLLTADVARGDGTDHSVFHIIKLETMEIIGEYQGKPNLDTYSTFLCSIGKEFGNCLLVVENNSIGISVLEKLKDLEYPNLYYSLKSSHEYIDALEAEHNTKALPGFSTTTKTRPLIVAKLEEFIRNKLIRTNSVRLFNELKTFIWKNGKPQAMRSYNDDLVMALAIGCWVRDTALQVNERDVEYKKAMLDGMFTSSRMMNTAIEGMDGYQDVKKQKKIEETIKQQTEFAWIFRG